MGVIQPVNFLIGQPQVKDDEPLETKIYETAKII